MGNLFNKQQNQDWENFIQQTNGDRSEYYNGLGDSRGISSNRKVVEKKMVQGELKLFLNEQLIVSNNGQEGFGYIEGNIEIKEEQEFQLKCYIWCRPIVFQNKLGNIECQREFYITEFNRIENRIHFRIEEPVTQQDYFTQHQFNNSTVFLCLELKTLAMRVLYFYSIGRENHQIILRLVKKGIDFQGEFSLIEMVYGLSSYTSHKEGEEECIVCMCEKLDTIVQPCGHLCICHGCAHNLPNHMLVCPVC